jgi:hypothetical protein
MVRLPAKVNERQLDPDARDVPHIQVMIERLHDLPAVPSVALAEVPRIVLTTPSLPSIEIMFSSSLGNLINTRVLNRKELLSETAYILSCDEYSAEEGRKLSIIFLVGSLNIPFHEHPLTCMTVDIRDHEQRIPLRCETSLDPGFGVNSRVTRYLSGKLSARGA